MKLPGAELELADAQLASWANAALVGWFYKPPTKVNHRPPNEAWLRPNGFRVPDAKCEHLLGQGLRRVVPYAAPSLGLGHTVLKQCQWRVARVHSEKETRQGPPAEPGVLPSPSL